MGSLDYIFGFFYFNFLDMGMFISSKFLI